MEQFRALTLGYNTGLFQMANKHITKFADLSEIRYCGSSFNIEQVKDYIDAELGGDVQLLDAAQTFLSKALSALTLATSEFKENYTSSDIKRINKIHEEISSCWSDLDEIIIPKL